MKANRTTALMKLHERATAILQMIQDADKYQRNCIRNAQEIKADEIYYLLRDRYKDCIVKARKYAKVAARLRRSYGDTLQRINQTAVK